MLIGRYKPGGVRCESELRPGLGVWVVPASCQEAKSLTPEQVEKDQPKGKVTVTFRVENVALLTGLVPMGDPPYMPISLGTAANLKDKRSKFYVVLVKKALAQVHRLGIDPVGHFRGKTIEVSGEVTYIALPRITGPGGAVEIPADNYLHCQMVISDLDDFRIVR